MRPNSFLDLMRKLGQWRCERRQGNGQGTGVCHGDPYHSCNFILKNQVRPKIIRLRSFLSQQRRRPKSDLLAT